MTVRLRNLFWPSPAACVAGALHLLLLCAPVFVIEGPRTVLADPRAVLLLSLATAWFLAESSVSRIARQDSPRDTAAQWLAPSMGLAILCVFWASLMQTSPTALPLAALASVLGTMLMATGITLRCLAISTLGDYFLNDVTVLPGQPMVRHGVFSLMRHPSELGTVCLVLGSAILRGSPAGAIAAIAVIVAVTCRCRLEDRVLRRNYALEFDRYAHDVPAFIPRLRRRWRHSEVPA